MGPILSRYVFRETAQTWFSVTIVLLLILLTDQFANVLDDTAAAKLPKDAIFPVMGLSSVQYLTILIPVGVFLAVIMALARMYRDSEMTALMACGIGNVSLYRPVFLLSVILAAIVGWLSLEVGPSAQREVKQIMDDAKATSDLGVLQAGKFITFGRENDVLYAESVGADGVLEGVFVQRRSGKKVVAIVAERADQRTDLQTSQKVLTFYNGERYEGVPGSREFRTMSFGEHGIPFSIESSAPDELSPSALPALELLERRDAQSVAELQWRLSAPITLLVLTLIAVPLSRSSPRQGRYSNLAYAILLYIIYTNLLGAAKVWVEKEVLSPWLGLWWVHGVFFLLGILMLQQQNRFIDRLFRRQTAPAAELKK